MILKQRIFVLVVIIGLTTKIKASYENECEACDPKACPVPVGCLAGTVKDHCGCCSVCGVTEGAPCDNEGLPLQYKTKYGYCGEKLECRIRTDLPLEEPPEALCFCIHQKSICGSDGKTYQNECQLIEARNKWQDGLHIKNSGPCTTAPTIEFAPEDTYNTTGSYVVLSCEASGWPIPIIHWRVDLQNGIQKFLPCKFVSPILIAFFFVIKDKPPLWAFCALSRGVSNSEF
ncbi:insulin-like growth factor-binding protein-related protein 1 [Limulus polyphemus]|uniref:Insulin-like growth factor-binding protein-related protein 1 n=1 Tax=Limulus polyphemus TaxID=6850 RepID=A0ABM1RX22_LIMPO|nr:insulin-like growth factor-binding protein-related protein 1 [Limulus polyphemus]